MLFDNLLWILNLQSVAWNLVYFYGWKYGSEESVKTYSECNRTMGFRSIHKILLSQSKLRWMNDK